MPIVKFPPHNQADPDGLLAVGGDLHPKSLVLAYRQGIFPWPMGEDYPLTWFSPNPRAIITQDNFYISKRLHRYYKNNPLSLRFNHDFLAIINQCAQIPRKNQQGTWITQEIIRSYHELFQLDLAFCIGLYDEDQKLQAGLYGTCIDGLISAESMFTHIPNGSKICLIALMKLLGEAGIHWVDTQMISPVIESMGGEEIPREDFLQLIEQTPMIPKSQIFS